jgi:hypothetical protein
MSKETLEETLLNMRTALNNLTALYEERAVEIYRCKKAMNEMMIEIKRLAVACEWDGIPAPMDQWAKAAGLEKCAACYGSGTVGDLNGIDKPHTCPDCTGCGYVANTRGESHE